MNEDKINVKYICALVIYVILGLMNITVYINSFADQEHRIESLNK